MSTAPARKLSSRNVITVSHSGHKNYFYAELSISHRRRHLYYGKGSRPLAGWGLEGLFKPSARHEIRLVLIERGSIDIQRERSNRCTATC